MNQPIRITIFNEFVHEKTERIAKVYPQGIHGAIAEKLSALGDYEITFATLDMPENGLSEDVLNRTDVLIWWGHCRHDAVLDEVAEHVKNRVLAGMGFIPLHSAHLCKPFKLLMGTVCRSKWRENDEKERIWVIEPSHPHRGGTSRIHRAADGGDIRRAALRSLKPDDLIFISWFSGGEAFPKRLLLQPRSWQNLLLPCRS